MIDDENKKTEHLFSCIVFRLNMWDEMDEKKMRWVNYTRTIVFYWFDDEE